jgi:hypothetical protein
MLIHTQNAGARSAGTRSLASRSPSPYFAQRLPAAAGIDGLRLAVQADQMRPESKSEPLPPLKHYEPPRDIGDAESRSSPRILAAASAIIHIFMLTPPGN